MPNLSPARLAPESQPTTLQTRFATLFGACLGLALLKFGNPPIMEKFVEPPANVYEFFMGYPWPIGWGFALLTLTAVVGLPAGQYRRERWPWWLLPLVGWMAWLVLSSVTSIDQKLSSPTVRHFSACCFCLLLGFFYLPGKVLPKQFWLGLLAGFSIMLAVGWEQHFGGLEETRRYFFLYVYPQLKEVPPEYLKKISSNRIFSTLFYPNTLAGALLLLTPPMLTVVWQAGGRGRMTPAARGFLLTLVAVGSLGCLLWSGSKGGWLIMLLLLLGLLLRLPLSKKLKYGLLLGVIAVGLAGFFWRYAGFFQKGATSVVARFDYWRAAAQTAVENPILGTGPGTFAIPYQAIKRPEAEMARLVHNDYLQQASDSGFPACLFYSLLIFGTLFLTFRSLKPSGWDFDSPDFLAFTVWLGVAGWAAQSFIDFGLYIPALAWIAFAFLGWLSARAQL